MSDGPFTTPTRTCADCAWFRVHSPTFGVGNCMVAPPVPLLRNTGNDTQEPVDVRPEVYDTDYCAQWRQTRG